MPFRHKTGPAIEAVGWAFSALALACHRNVDVVSVWSVQMRICDEEVPRGHINSTAGQTNVGGLSGY